MATLEPKYQFGADPAEIGTKLAEIAAGIGDNSIIVQMALKVNLSVIDDFEFEQVTIMYAKKRERKAQTI